MALPKAERSGQDTDVHVLMPTMAYACGGSILTAKGKSVFSALTEWHAVTCQACLAIGQELIWRAAKRSQGHDTTTCTCEGCRRGRTYFGDEPTDLLDLL